MGKIVPAQIADHVTPHRGDAQLFWYGTLTSLCASCHSGTKQEQEKKGYSTDVGVDGWPVDEQHPVYRAGRQSVSNEKHGRQGGLSKKCDRRGRERGARRPLLNGQNLTPSGGDRR
jgi:hypothetical protein